MAGGQGVKDLMMNVAELISELTNECRLRGSDPRDVTVYLRLDHRGYDVDGEVDRVERQGSGGMVVAGS